MKIIANRYLNGPDGCFAPGDIGIVPDDVAKGLIDAGAASPVSGDVEREPVSIETADIDINEAETAVVDITAKAKRMADEAGIDINTIVGSGRDGQIIVRDVKKIIEG